MADMKAMKGFGGLGKMGSDKPEPKEPKAKMDPAKDMKGKVDGEGEKVHTITEHGDGTITSKMHDGGEEQHPDHLHMMAHLGHHITGGDKHHIAHHDGMGVSTHGIHEDGQHEETMQHGSGDEAGEHAKSFLNDSGSEQTQQQPEEAQEAMPAYGGMG